VPSEKRRKISYPLLGRTAILLRDSSKGTVDGAPGVTSRRIPHLTISRDGSTVGRLPRLFDGEDDHFVPVGTATSEARAVVSLGLHSAFVLGQAPIYLMLFGAILGCQSVVLSTRALSTISPGPRRLMASIDLGVALTGTGAIVYDPFNEN